MEVGKWLKDKNLQEKKFFRLIIGLFKNIYLFFHAVFSEFARSNCFIRASGLAFATILALVPLTVVIVSLMTALGALGNFYEYLRDILTSQFIPAYRDVVIHYLNQFIQNTKALGSLGSIFFFVTSIFLFTNISNNFNAIWTSHRQVSLVSQLKTYLAILLGGSLFISLGITASSSITLLFQLQGNEASGWIFVFLKKVSPLVFLYLGLLLMILFVPTGKVNFRSALLASAIGLVIWETSAIVFNYWVSNVIKIHLIYGPLAAIPLLLIWVYVIWLIILFSLVMTSVFQNRNIMLRSKVEGQLYPDEHLVLGLEIFMYICTQYFRHKNPPNLNKIARRYYCTEKQIQSFIRILIENGLVLHVASPIEGYIPAKPLSHIQFNTVMSILFSAHSPMLEAPSPGWEHDAIVGVVESFSKNIENQKENLDMESFILAHLPVRKSP